MTKQVVIFGDSWAFSSWRKGQNSLEILDTLNFQLLFANHNILATNLAMPANSNLDSIRLMHENADFLKQIDLAIVFQTDPIRQLVRKDFLTDKDSNKNGTWKVQMTEQGDKEIPICDSLPDLCEKLLTNFYKELEIISTTHNVPILLIGGCAPLSFDNVPKRIFTIDRSWTELCVTNPQYKDCYYYWVNMTLCVYENARKKFNWPSSLADFFEFEQMILEKHHIWRTSDHFSWCHAGESAYRIMFGEILSTMKKINFERNIR